MRVFGVVVLLLHVLLPPLARAEIGTLDEVPAATLLLPYFEVDLASMSGRTTVFTIGNTQDSPSIAHVTLWTDLSYPTLTFDVYLTGYDVQTVNLRDVFATGNLPGTSHSNTTISPVGFFSLATHPDTGVGPGSASCNSLLPPLPLSPALLTHLRATHTGQASVLVLGGTCTGFDHGDTIARGYITIDNALSCSQATPDTDGYFVNGGAGVASNVNALVGDFAYIDTENARAEGHALIHLEAGSSPQTQPGDYTFYARYSGGADNREALPTTYAARYVAQGIGGETSSFLYWRDSKRDPSPFNCALLWPSPFPLSTNQIAIFDAAENVELPEVIPFSPPPLPPGSELLPFPWEAGTVLVGSADLPVTALEGWMFLNLNSTVTGSQVPHQPSMQAWIGISTTGGSEALSYGYGLEAIALDNAGSFAELLLPVCDGSPDPTGCPPLFADGFESGDTSAWSMVVP